MTEYAGPISEGERLDCSGCGHRWRHCADPPSGRDPSRCPNCDWPFTEGKVEREIQCAMVCGRPATAGYTDDLCATCWNDRVVVDHYAIESAWGPMLAELHRWDKPEVSEREKIATWLEEHAEGYVRSNPGSITNRMIRDALREKASKIRMGEP